MCAPVVLVGGVTRGSFKIAGRVLVRLVVRAQGPVAQQQRDREHERQEAPRPPAGNRPDTPGARCAEQRTRLPFASIYPSGVYKVSLLYVRCQGEHGRVLPWAGRGCADFGEGVECEVRETHLIAVP